MSRRLLVVALLLGLAVRLGVLWNTPDLGLVNGDEEQYVQLARSLLHGDGFAWGPGRPTSLRPPLYPAIVAGLWSVAGEDNLQAVRVLQFGLALLTAALVYALGTRVFGRPVGLVAAVVTWLYPTLIFLNVTILTETLFTLLLVAFVLLAVMLVQQPKWWTALACGVILGLGALTRSVLWPVPLLLCPLLILQIPRPVRSRLALAALVLAGYAATVSPWAVRNTRLQGVPTIVDTMAGLNLRMGNYEYTPDARMWDAVSLTGEESWVYALGQEDWDHTPTEGEKDEWARRKAVEYMLANPGTTVRRAAIKFGDFWGIERTFFAGVQHGLYGPPRWFAVLAVASIALTCVSLIVLGFAGVWLSRPDWRAQVLLLLPVALITFAHSVTFGHPRYHVPLVPLLAVFAAALYHAAGTVSLRRDPVARLGAALTTGVFVLVWIRQVVLEIPAILNRLSNS